MSHHRFICCLIWAMGTCTPITFAQDEDRDAVDTSGIIIEGSIGFDGVVDTEDPLPISFLLTNNSQKIIEGNLFITSPASGDEVFLGEVTLAPSSTRRFSTIRKVDNWLECYAEFRAGGEVAWRRELPINTGSTYQTEENFVLLVDDSGRRLMTRKANTNATILATQSYGRSSVSGVSGREVRSLNAKSWQIPNHPAALASIQAIIYPEATPAKQLNRVQWRCLAEWVCEGGTFYFHSESKDVFAAITKESPLVFELSEGSETNTVRRIGLGELREYSATLFSSKGAKARQRLTDEIRLLAGSEIRDTVKEIYVNGPDVQTEVQQNRLYVAGLFGIYTLFIGLFTLLMFRFSKRVVAIYTMLVVAGASVAAGTLGGMLRFSQGDLKWASVSYVGAGGLVQVARFDVQSSGGRNEDVAVKGKTPNLQFTGQTNDTRNYYWRNQEPRDANPAFDLQLNRFGADVKDAFKVKVRMTPWGRRQLHATDFKAGVKGLDLKLEYTTGDKDDAERARPQGRFKLTAKNTSGFQVRQSWILIGVSRYSESQTNENVGYYVGGQPVYVDDWGNPISQSLLMQDQMIDLYQTEAVKIPPVGESAETEFGSRLDTRDGMHQMQQYTDVGEFHFRRISRGGTARAWVYLLVSRSPVLQVDEPNTEFTPQNELHLIIQEIAPENMPDAKLFLGKKPPPPPKPDVDTGEE